MKNLRHLNKYFVKHLHRIIPGIFFVILSNIFGIFSAQILRHAVDLIGEYLWLYNESKESEVSSIYLFKIVAYVFFVFALTYLFFHILKGLFLFFMRQTIIVASRHIEYELKNEIYEHIQSLPISFFRFNKTGDIMTRIIEDVSRVRMYVGPAFMYTINLFFLFIITISIMFYVNVELSIYTLMPLPLLSITIYYVSNLIHKKSEIIQAQLSHLNILVHETFSGVRLLKAFNQEKNFSLNFDNASESYKAKSLSLVKIEALFFPLMILLIGLSTVITIFIGGIQVIEGKISYGNIVEFVYYINLLTWPVTAIGWIASIIQRAEVSQKRINTFLNESNTITVNKDINHNISGSISVNDVHFTYPETGIKAIDNISFKINAGEKVAIVGKTGSGKSSIAQLLLRMYDPEKGNIIIDNNNIKDINLSHYREQIGYAPQDNFLFSDTISNNISFGKPNSLIKEIEYYSKMAVVDIDIMKLPNGFNTFIGERGITLSGGQKQRISLARALIKDPKLLVLDDCLSAVDTETEFNILKNLNDLFKEKTVIFISHRVLSLKSMDKIIVLKNGKIVESGPFNILIENKGLFYGLYQQQKLQKSLSH